MKHSFNISNILVPLDFSGSSMKALQAATELAQKFKANIHLLHIVNPRTTVLPSLNEVVNTSNFKDEIGHHLNEIAEKNIAPFNIEYQTEIRDGSVAKEIVGSASDKNCDIIVMGTHGLSGVEEFFIGSQAYRVVTAATCPVLTIQENSKHERIEKIALPIDSTAHTRDKVTETIAMAKMYDAKVYLAGLITEDHEEEEAIFKLKMKQIEDILSAENIPFDSKVIYGDDIAEMTNNFSQAIGADLLIIMTEQEASTGLFVGPHAQRIINQSRIPVLSVTPIGTIKGFSQDDLAGGYRPFYV